MKRVSKSEAKKKIGALAAFISEMDSVDLGRIKESKKSRKKIEEETETEEDED